MARIPMTDVTARRRHHESSRAKGLDPDFASAHAMAAWCHFWRKVNGWMGDRVQEIAEGARLARRAVELGEDDAVALTRSGHALGHLADDLDSGHRPDRQGTCAQCKSLVRLVPWRLPEGLERRTRQRHRVLRARDAS